MTDKLEQAIDYLIYAKSRDEPTDGMYYVDQALAALRSFEGERVIEPLRIGLGHGLILVSDGRVGDKPALLFSRGGNGVIGNKNYPQKRYLVPGEEIAAITFENVESLAVVLEELHEIAEKQFGVDPNLRSIEPQRTVSRDGFTSAQVNGALEELADRLSARLVNQKTARSTARQVYVTLQLPATQPVSTGPQHPGERDDNGTGWIKKSDHTEILNKAIDEIDRLKAELSSRPPVQSVPGVEGEWFYKPTYASETDPLVNVSEAIRHLLSRQPQPRTEKVRETLRSDIQDIALVAWKSRAMTTQSLMDEINSSVDAALAKLDKGDDNA